MSQGPNRPRTGPTSFQRLPAAASRDRRNASRAGSAAELAAPFTVDRNGRQSIAVGRYLIVTPDGKLDLNVERMRADGLLT